jgi:hypothetical protein
MNPFALPPLAFIVFLPFAVHKQHQKVRVENNKNKFQKVIFEWKKELPYCKS